MNQAWLLHDLLARLTTSWVRLPDKPEETPVAALRALWWTVAGEPCSAERARQGDLPALSEVEVASLRELVAERVSGVPLSHLTGRQLFMELEMVSGPEALIPRKETEILGYAALERLIPLIEERGSATVIDVCTGCGNVVLALAHHEPRGRYWGSDLSSEAIDLAQRNAKHLAIEDRVEFLVGDLLEPFSQNGPMGNVDMITCNPPYISTGRVAEMPSEISGHEPSMAFDGGPFGMSILLRLIRESVQFLKPNSWLCFEVGLGQGPPLMARLQKAAQFDEVVGVRDAQGEVRALLARTAAL